MLIPLIFLQIIVAKPDSTIYMPTDPLLVTTSTCPSPDPALNYRPIIGIVSHPGDGASGRLSNATNASYIAASYVKFVESAGARVIPLIYNEPLQNLQTVSFRLVDHDFSDKRKTVSTCLFNRINN